MPGIEGKEQGKRKLNFLAPAVLVHIYGEYFCPISRFKYQATCIQPGYPQLKGVTLEQQSTIACKRKENNPSY